jgi:hypothetical protein
LRLALWPRLIALQLGAGVPPFVEVTCKFCDADVALPGFGLVMATANVPAEDSLPVAVNCVEDTNVVASGAPARSTCAPLTNPLPLTVIANVPAGTYAGAIPDSTGTGFSNVMELLPVTLPSAELTAVTVTVPAPAMFAGAVYMPVELIVPVVALPFATPFTCQLTAVFVAPETAALKDCAAPARTLTVAGESTTETPAPAGGAELEFCVVPVMLPQPAIADNRNNSAK